MSMLDSLYREASEVYRAMLASTRWRMKVSLRWVSLGAQRAKIRGRARLGSVPRRLTMASDAARLSGGWWRFFVKLVSRARRDGFGGSVRRLLYLGQGRHCLQSFSPFSFDQYAPHALAERLRVGCTDAPLVSFDLFDTLVLRPFARPDAVFWMLEERIADEYGIPDFAVRRRQAEALARATREPGRDVPIEVIYRVLSELLKLTPEHAASLLQLEVVTEQGLFRINPVVADALWTLRQAGRRLILVSDMYLGEAHLRPVLGRLGLDVFDRLYVSADTGRRKDRGDVWDHVLEQEGIERAELQHVGDNEHSDVQALVDRGFPHPVHVMRPAALIGLLPGGQALIRTFRERPSWRNELILGLIANRVNRQLTTTSEPTHRPFSEPETFGYSVIGPILLVFMTWLIQRLHQDGVTSARFLSREGWLLERLYGVMRSHPAVTAVAPDLPMGGYLYGSRSVVGLAAVSEASHGLREAMRDHWASFDAVDDHRPAIIDIGYSGTIQLALMRVLGQPLSGYYFLTNALAGRVLDGGGRCESCFGNLLPRERMQLEDIHRYALVLEAVLTSREGRLAGFERRDRRVVPVFKPGGAAPRGFATLERIHAGALEFCTDVLDAVGSAAVGGDWDLQAVSGLLPLVVGRQLDIGPLSQALSVEDQCSGNQGLSVLDFYERQSTESGGL